MFGATLPVALGGQQAKPVVIRQFAQPTTTANKPPAPQKPLATGSAPASGSGATTPTATPTPAQPAQVSPYGGAYQEQLAPLQHQYENALAGAQTTYEGSANAIGQKQGTLDRALPLNLSTTRATANSQGLLESGQLAQRAGGVEQKYAEQRNALVQQLQAAAGKQISTGQSALTTLQSRSAEASTKAIEAARAEDEKLGVNETTQTPTTPVAPAVVKPTTTAVRQAASKNVLAKAKAKGRKL